MDEFDNSKFAIPLIAMLILLAFLVGNFVR